MPLVAAAGITCIREENRHGRKTGMKEWTTVVVVPGVVVVMAVEMAVFVIIAVVRIIGRLLIVLRQQFIQILNQRT